MCGSVFRKCLAHFKHDKISTQYKPAALQHELTYTERIDRNARLKNKPIENSQPPTYINNNA